MQCTLLAAVGEGHTANARASFLISRYALVRDYARQMPWAETPTEDSPRPLLASTIGWLPHLHGNVHIACYM